MLEMATRQVYRLIPQANQITRQILKGMWFFFPHNHSNRKYISGHFVY